ncbi:conserved hypothetical protein [Flavobacterium sp. 9AF]|uniref:alpha/beta hydrolase n=1 Tax=Flavobacterium sp. 9AF TaxID=2653142 RepID=UPI0012F389D9|nr:alpha/beta hydrolase [Flavobacterium sp. 9AF]VXC18303.1 conserved hypothetical protein [Flavobacterium sp. 9AF]
MKHLLILFFIPLFSICQIKTQDIEINSLIKGTLFSTEKNAKKPNLIILIAGSGPTDRNGNQQQMQTNSLKLLAEGITNANNSVFSYDKRLFSLIKNNTFNEKDLNFEDGIKDVKDIISYFKLQKKYSKIIIAGHSEGSLIGMIAAKNNADAFISIAGAGRPADELIIEQIEKQTPMLVSEVKENFTSLKKGEVIEIKNPLLATLFRESIQPYMISWIKYNPQEEIKNLKVPILIINGTNDIQVSQKEAKLLKVATPTAKLVIIDNMNHVLKNASADRMENLSTYNNPDLPIVPELVFSILNFIKAL